MQVSDRSHLALIDLKLLICEGRYHGDARGDFVSEHRILERALRSLTRLLGEEHTEVAFCKLALTRPYMEHFKNFRKAERLLNEALAALEDVCSPNACIFVLISRVYVSSNGALTIPPFPCCVVIART